MIKLMLYAVKFLSVQEFGDRKQNKPFCNLNRIFLLRYLMCNWNAQQKYKTTVNCKSSSENGIDAWNV